MATQQIPTPGGGPPTTAVWDPIASRYVGQNEVSAIYGQLLLYWQAVSNAPRDDAKAVAAYWQPEKDWEFNYQHYLETNQPLVAQAYLAQRPRVPTKTVVSLKSDYTIDITHGAALVKQPPLPTADTGQPSSSGGDKFMGIGNAATSADISGLAKRLDALETTLSQLAAIVQTLAAAKTPDPAPAA
jgi:hypothetical protein